MAGELTAMLARSVRHSLGITGIALLVAGSVAFLPLGSTGSSANQTDASLAAATSLEAMRSVFVAAAEASAGTPPSDQAAAPDPAALAATAPPTLEPSNLSSATATPSEAAQAIVSSALQQATATPASTRAAAAPVATAAVRTSVSIPAIEEILAQSPWPRELWPTVERIIICESSGNPGAVSPAGYVGLMQVAPWLHGAVPADPVAQLAQAYGVYLRQGWGAWGCY